MPQRMLTIKTTRQQREIMPVALDIAKKLAQDTASALSRLNVPNRKPTEIIGNLAHIRGEFDKVLPAQEGTVKIEIDAGSALVAKTALGLWASMVLKRDKADQLVMLKTNVSEVHKEAQDLLNQLNEQLSLDFEDIRELDSKDRSEDDEAAEEDGDKSKRGGAKAGAK